MNDNCIEWTNDFHSSQQSNLKEIEDELNRQIQEEDAKITLRKVYESVGLPTPLHFDPKYDLMGWDKKGFRQLYLIVQYLIPVD